VTLRQLFYEEGNILSVLQLPGSKRFSAMLGVLLVMKTLNGE